MTRFGSSVALTLMLAWVLQGLTLQVFHPVLATALALTAGAVVAFGLARTMVVGGAVALLAPFGVMLPALAFWGMSARLALGPPGFSGWELVVFLAGYTVFLLSAFGTLRVDLYRLGYAPLPVAGMVLAVCLYGALSGNWFVPLVAVISQVFWVMNWGSSNWFDYMLHLLLWPIALITLILRLF